MHTDLRGTSHRSQAYHYMVLVYSMEISGYTYPSVKAWKVPAGFGRFRLVDVIFRMSSKISDPFK